MVPSTSIFSETFTYTHAFTMIIGQERVLYIIGKANRGVKIIRPGSTVVTSLPVIVFPDDFIGDSTKYYCACDNKIIGIW